MPKKSPARHQAQRPQPKKKDVVLVRATSTAEVAAPAEEEVEEQAAIEATQEAGAKAISAATAKKPERTKPLAHQESSARPSSQPVRTPTTTQRSGRVPQRPSARIQVGRQSNLVTPEHYRYVLKDLRLIGALAVIMFGIIIALTFVLPHFLQY